MLLYKFRRNAVDELCTERRGTQNNDCDINNTREGSLNKVFVQNFLSLQFCLVFQKKQEKFIVWSGCIQFILTAADGGEVFYVSVSFDFSHGVIQIAHDL